MNRIELTQDVLCEKVVTPIVLGMFANYEWESIAMLRDTDDERRLIARIVVAGEAIEVLLDFPGNDESLYDMQERLVEEFRAFIETSEFGARRTPSGRPTRSPSSRNRQSSPALRDRTSTAHLTAFSGTCATAAGSCASTAAAASPPTAAAESTGIPRTAALPIAPQPPAGRHWYRPL
ncbi:hypothetical protein [Brevibacterium siliguriense]|nr:hypothetical protein [Brevibacterium siliguriense]